MGNQQKLTASERSEYENNYLIRFKGMLTEPRGSFVKYFQLLDQSLLELRSNPSFHKYIVMSVKSMVKDSDIGNAQKIRSLFLLKDCLASMNTPLIHFTQNRFLPRLEKIAKDSKGAEQFISFGDQGIDRQLSIDVYRLILECLSKWSVQLSPINFEYKAVWSRVQTALKMPSIREEELQLYYLPPRPQASTSIINEGAGNMAGTNSGNLHSIVPPSPNFIVSGSTPESLRYEIMQILTKDDINEDLARSVFRRFDELPQNLKSEAPEDVNFFVNLREYFKSPQINKEGIYTFLLETAQDDMEFFPRVLELFEKYQGDAHVNQLRPGSGNLSNTGKNKGVRSEGSLDEHFYQELRDHEIDEFQNMGLKELEEELRKRLANYKLGDEVEAMKIKALEEKVRVMRLTNGSRNSPDREREEQEARRLKEEREIEARQRELLGREISALEGQNSSLQKNLQEKEQIIQQLMRDQLLSRVEAEQRAEKEFQARLLALSKAEKSKRLRSEYELLNRDVEQVEREKRELELRIESLRAAQKEDQNGTANSNFILRPNGQQVIDNSRLIQILNDQTSTVENLNEKINFLELQLQKKQSESIEAEEDPSRPFSSTKSSFRRRRERELYGELVPGLGRVKKGGIDHFVDEIYSNIDLVLRKSKHVVF